MITKGVSTGNGFIAEMTDVTRVLNMSTLHVLIHVVLVLAHVTLLQVGDI